MVRIRFALILYFHMVANKSACFTQSKAFLNQRRDGIDFADVGGTFYTGS